MFIIEDVVKGNINILRVENALKDLGYEYMKVKVIGNEIKVLDKELYIESENGAEIWDNYVKENQGKIVKSYGSKNLTKALRGYGLKDNYEYALGMDKLVTIMRDELVSSKGIQIGYLHELTMEDKEEKFIRPVGNTKGINGQIVDKKLLESIKKYKDGTLNHEKYFMADIEYIQEEYRLFIIKGKIISGSKYRPNVYKLDNEEVKDYVTNLIKNYKINGSLTIDVGLTSKGLKVIEFNNINTSGLYAGNEYEIISNLN